MMPTMSCADSCDGGASIGCSSPAQCQSGEVCCATFGGGGGGGGGFNVACASSCSMGFQLCASQADCPSGATCTMGFGGTSYCRMPRDGGFMFDGGFMRDSGMGGGADATSADGPTE
jgi:hypothetical protein